MLLTPNPSLPYFISIFSSSGSSVFVWIKFERIWINLNLFKLKSWTPLGSRSRPLATGPHSLHGPPIGALLSLAHSLPWAPFDRPDVDPPPLHALSVECQDRPPSCCAPRAPCHCTPPFAPRARRAAAPRRLKKGCCRPLFHSSLLSTFCPPRVPLTSDVVHPGAIEAILMTGAHLIH
jgi:hypothetical protein